MTTNNQKLTGKVAVVTGGAAGIGLAVTELFLLEGAKVLAVDYSESNIELARKQLQSKSFDPKTYFFQNADISDEDSVITFIERAMNELGGLDIIVLNAGVGAILPISEVTMQEWDRQMRINARGPFLGVKYGAEKMRSVGKGGSIIITASLACEAAFPELAPYNMSKFAVRALSVTAAQEYAKDKIRVNTVSPGFVNTALVGVWPQLQERLAATPAGRAAEPAEVANLFLFLASNDAVMVSGSNYRIDGGMVMH